MKNYKLAYWEPDAKGWGPRQRIVTREEAVDLQNANALHKGFTYPDEETALQDFIDNNLAIILEDLLDET